MRIAEPSDREAKFTYLPHPLVLLFSWLLALSLEFNEDTQAARKKELVIGEATLYAGSKRHSLMAHAMLFCPL